MIYIINLKLLIILFLFFNLNLNNKILNSYFNYYEAGYEGSMP